MVGTQIPERFQIEIDEQVEIFNQRRTFEGRRSIPDTDQIPLVDRKHWFRIDNVICVFADIMGSTRLSAETREDITAGAYQLFTGTAVALFDKFEASYIDVKGDGAFGLFNSGQEYRAFCAAVTIKTFANKVFLPTIKEKASLDLGCHLGIDQNRVLVRRIGLKRYPGRSDRQNEVWAGKPVNMAAKLASRSGHLTVSDRFYSKITDEKARKSCGCVDGKPTQVKTDLWKKDDLGGNPIFDFPEAYRLESVWCGLHGAEYCESLLRKDS